MPWHRVDSLSMFEGGGVLGVRFESGFRCFRSTAGFRLGDLAEIFQPKLVTAQAFAWSVVKTTYAR